MNILESFNKMYKATGEIAQTLTDNYQKATIYASMLNSLSRLIAADTNSSNAESATETVESATVTKNTEIEAKVQEIEATEPVVSEKTPEPAVDVQAAEPVTEEAPAVGIDHTSEEDDDEWTERMLEKYQAEIDYVNQAIADFGEDEINKFVDETTNHLFASFEEMNPTTFVATYELLKIAVESSDE